MDSFSIVDSWEYPNADGIGCNVKNSMDASNFLSFLQTLRTDTKGSSLVLSAATSIKPWNGQDGQPLSDVSQFASVLDFICKCVKQLRSGTVLKR